MASAAFIMMPLCEKSEGSANAEDLFTGGDRATAETHCHPVVERGVNRLGGFCTVLKHQGLSVCLFFIYSAPAGKAEQSYHCVNVSLSHITGEVCMTSFQSGASFEI